MARVRHAQPQLCETLYSAGTATQPALELRARRVAARRRRLLRRARPRSPASRSTRGTQFPAEYRDALFMADYARRLHHGDAAPAPTGCPTRRRRGSSSPTPPAPSTSRWVRTARLYYVDLEGGSIHRIAFPAGNNAPDRARHRDARPRAGAAQRRLRRQRLDRPRERRPSTYSWDLDGDGTFGDATIAEARLHVHDARAPTRSACASPTPPAGPTPSRCRSPPATRRRSRSTAPTAAFTWAVGDAVAYAGSAVDGQGNPIPPVRPLLAAQHPATARGRIRATATRTSGATVAGVASGTFVAPEPRLPVAAAGRAHREGHERAHRFQERHARPQDRRHHARQHPAGRGADDRRGHRERAVHRALHPERHDRRHGAVAADDRRPRLRLRRLERRRRDHPHDHGPADRQRPTPPRSAACSDEQARGRRRDRHERLHGERGPRRGVPHDRRRGGPGLQAAPLRRPDVDRHAPRPRALRGRQRRRSARCSARAPRRPVTPGAWNEVTLASPIQIQQGTAYWIGLLNPTGGSGVLSWRDRAGGSGGS